LRHDLFRAGHAHAGVYLVLSVVMLRYVDEAMLSHFWKWIARIGAPIAAILIPAAFFFSVASPIAKEPNVLIKLAYDPLQSAIENMGDIIWLNNDCPDPAFADGRLRLRLLMLIAVTFAVRTVQMRNSFLTCCEASRER
jgi:hypothetical protein